MPRRSLDDENPSACLPDLTYSITSRVLVNRDTVKGKQTVLEDLPAMLRRIEHWHPAYFRFLPELRFAWGEVVSHRNATISIDFCERSL